MITSLVFGVCMGAVAGRLCAYGDYVYVVLAVIAFGIDTWRLKK